MISKIKYLFEFSDLTIERIAEEVGLTFKQVYTQISKLYTKEERQIRKKQCYRNSKLGDKNPMRNKCGELHHNYIGDISDGKGYELVLKPIWYAGRKGTKHIFKHHLVICEALAIREIPKGWCVHHIDGNKVNNKLENLALMTTSAHNRLHIHKEQNFPPEALSLCRSDYD